MGGDTVSDGYGELQPSQDLDLADYSDFNAWNTTGLPNSSRQESAGAARWCCCSVGLGWRPRRGFCEAAEVALSALWSWFPKKSQKKWRSSASCVAILVSFVVSEIN